MNFNFVQGCCGQWFDGKAWLLQFLGGEERPATSEETHAAAVADISSQINAERDRRNALPLSVNNELIQVDAASLILLMRLKIIGAEAPASFQWMTASGKLIPMTPGLADAINKVSTLREVDMRGAALTHIAAASQLDDPLKYDFGKGWPG